MVTTTPITRRPDPSRRPTRRRTTEHLVAGAALEQHDGTRTTNTQWYVAVWAVNALLAAVARHRLPTALAVRRVMRTTAATAQAVRVLTDAKQATLLRSLEAEREGRWTRMDTVGRHLHDVRLPRWTATALAAVVLAVDYVFMFTTFADLWSVSVQAIVAGLGDPGQLGPVLLERIPHLVGAMAAACFMPLLTIALGMSAGRQLAGIRDAATRPAEAEEDGVPWRLGRFAAWTLVGQLVALAGLSAWFWAVGVGRTAEADDSGLDGQGPLLAVVFMLLPFGVLLVECFSRSPLRERDERAERRYDRMTRRVDRLTRGVAAAQRVSDLAWHRLALRVARILDEANCSIQLVEQLFAHAFAVTGEVGTFAPLAAGGSADDLARIAAELTPAPDQRPAVPAVEQVRGLRMPLPDWQTKELDRALQVLVLHRPDSWTGPEAAAKRLRELGRPVRRPGAEIRDRTAV